MPKPSTPAPFVADRIRLVPLESLRSAEGNAKLHPPEQLAALVDSIQRFGFTAPIVTDAQLEIVAGHARAAAARIAGLEQVPIVQVEHLDATQLRALRLADNRIAELGRWDDELLAIELADLDELGALPEGLWSDGELERLLGDDPEETPAEPTRSRAAAQPRERPAAVENEPEPTEVDDGRPRWRDLVGAKAIVRKGELWEIAGHRLLVGDCRKPENLRKLTADAKADVVLTDPPYCSGAFQDAQRGAGTFGDIAADNLSTRSWRALLSKAIETAGPANLYLFTDWKMWCGAYDLVEAAGLAVRQMLVWDKQTAGLGALWRTQHELVLFATRRTNRREDGAATLGNVLSCKRSGNAYHYTEKPVELLERILAGDECAGRRGPVLDLFAGSGSTLVAAHARGRIGWGLEVEPMFAEIALRRLESATGERARCKGRTLDDVAARRSGD